MKGTQNDKQNEIKTDIMEDGQTKWQKDRQNDELEKTKRHIKLQAEEGEERK